MQPTDAFFLARLTEHLVVAIIGVFIAWMGYRLFREMPVRREGEAKVWLPGGISIYFSRIAPGTFFALFGAALIGCTATRPVSYQQGRDLVALSGFGDQSLPVAPGTAHALYPSAGAGLPRPGLVRTLAELAAENEAAPVSPKQIARAEALRTARVEIMLAGWDPSWGSQEDFRQWADSIGDTPPASASRAADVFSGR